jgi:hypothetical protein
MFCPKCGTNQSDDLKFCKTCGTNLQAVRLATEAREAGEKFDWGKTWVAEMFLSEGERKRRGEELERLRGITPEVKRYNEIKGGVITAFVGLALMIFLAVLMKGIVAGGNVPTDTVHILNSLWVAGVIPLFVGLGLMINGIFVGRKQVEALRRSMPISKEDMTQAPESLDRGTQPRPLRPADTSEFITPGFSVTEGTTQHLAIPAAKPQDPDNT